MWNLFFVKHMLNEESEGEYEDVPFIILVLTLIVEHMLDKKEVSHEMHPSSCLDSSW